MDLIRDGLNATVDKMQEVAAEYQGSRPSTSAHRAEYDGPPKIQSGYCALACRPCSRPSFTPHGVLPAQIPPVAWRGLEVTA